MRYAQRRLYRTGHQRTNCWYTDSKIPPYFFKKPVSKVGLLVDIEAAIRSGKGPGYERWAKVFNLKQLSQAVLYLKEHGDMGYEDLLEKPTPLPLISIPYPFRLKIWSQE